MDIELIDKTVVDIANKKLSGALSPDERNRIYALVNLDLFKLQIGLPEQYRIESPKPLFGFQVTFKSSDTIKKFLVSQTIHKNNFGVFPYPNDYAAFDYMLIRLSSDECDGDFQDIVVEAVTGGERAIRLSSKIIPPTIYRPICSWTSDGFVVDPQTITKVYLYYIRYPVTPYRAYTVNTSDEDVVNKSDPLYRDTEWPDTMFGDFVIRACRYMGINLREEEFVQYSLQRQIQGQ